MTRSELIRRIQAKQDREHKRRCRRIIKAINGVTTKFYDTELTELEGIVERAFGRVKLVHSR